MTEILFARLDEVDDQVAATGLLKANNLSDLSNVSTARTNLGGTSLGINLFTVADVAAAQTALELVIGTDVQAYDAQLDTWAGITPGTGVATALAINIGSAGAPVLFNGALGTPSSGNGSNITNVNAASLGGATFAAPGAIGGGTPAAGTFTTLTVNTSLNVAASGNNLVKIGTGTPVFGSAGFIISNGVNSYFAIDDGTRALLFGADVSGVFIGAYSNHPLVFRSNNSASFVSSTSGFGYPTGWGRGGTITQLTNKATGVTLNTPTGQITMNNAALAANTTVSFILTNSSITALDLIHVQLLSGNVTAGTYDIWSEKPTAGTVTINVRNISAGSLSEALVIQYMVTKGAIN